MPNTSTSHSCKCFVWFLPIITRTNFPDLRHGTEKFDQFGLKDNVENGLLTQKDIYDADGKILDRELYTYSTDEGETRRKLLIHPKNTETKT